MPSWFTLEAILTHMSRCFKRENPFAELTDNLDEIQWHFVPEGDFLAETINSWCANDASISQEVVDVPHCSLPQHSCKVNRLP